MNNNYKGKILISTPDISGDIFSRSVVLVVDHNEYGAFGLILNKKLKNSADRLEVHEGVQIDIYEGGPVEREKFFFIVKGTPITENYTAISEDYYITEDYENLLRSLAEGELTLLDFKSFLGYSGWSAQQLEAEVMRKSWTVVDIVNLDYTLPNNENLWKMIMQNLGGEFLLFANAPEDISLN